MSNKIRVAVFAGGVSSEREISLRSSEQVIKNLPADKYECTLIEVAKDGTWHLHQSTNIGPNPTQVPFAKPANVDVAFIGLHGTFAEDGRIQSLFEIIKLPYTGSGVLPSAIGMDKYLTRTLVAPYRIKAPTLIKLHHGDDTTTIKDQVGFPCVIKPNASGSSVGVTIVDTESQLDAAIKTAFAEGDTVLAEQYVEGREFACAVLGNTHETELTALPAIEIIPKSRFFDYEAKYNSSDTQEICPAHIDEATEHRIRESATIVHRTLGCSGLTRTDFILAPDGSLYLLEINTLPGMTETSLAPKEARAAGMTFAEFLDKQVRLGLLRFGIADQI